MHPSWLAMAGVCGFLSVAAGAFGAHALETRLGPEMMGVFETGTRYLMGTVAGLLGVAAVGGQRPGRSVTVAGVGLSMGVAVFTGSLWLLAITGERWLGALTPMGGMAMLVGWASLIGAALRGSARPQTP